MADLADSITAIREGAKEDTFTYLTILEYHVKSPDVLPALNDVLQDAELTKQIGWDLVQLLLRVQGSEQCLETVSRLGNPREVIIKVMESLDGIARTMPEAADEAEDTAGAIPQSQIPDAFIILLGMLAILHKRIKTKYPSRFLGQSLVKVLGAYRPTPEMTASVINLVRSLSGRKRPPLPQRTSSINVVNPDHDGDNSKNAPDPEAEITDPAEDAKQAKLLQSFVTCVIQQFVNSHEMQWSPRLLETARPEKSIPGKKRTIEVYREDETLQKRDAVVGNLVALARDLGLDRCSAPLLRSVIEGASSADPLETFEDFDSADDIHLSPGGAVCLIAYWMFSSDVFSADHPDPEMSTFPDHQDLLKLFCGIDPQGEISTYPGVADALVSIGLSLKTRGHLSAEDSTENNTMAYHHYLSLISVFHPNLQVRNAANALAEMALQANPDDQVRFEILEDLLENCMFPSMKASAVSWLKHEIAEARKNKVDNKFSSPDIVESLQYSLFPDLISYVSMDAESLLQEWMQNQIFLLQVANLAYFLFVGCKDLVPAGVAAAVEERFSTPLKTALDKIEKLEGLDGEALMQIHVLNDRLSIIHSQ